MKTKTTLWESIGFNQKLAPYIFVSPFFILFVIFGMYPLVYSIYMSFFDMRLVGNRGFVGLSNYTRLFTTDAFFAKSLINTSLLLIFGSILQHVFAIPLAIGVNSKRLKARHLFKTLVFAPYITSAVATVIIFGMVFDHNHGVLNYLLETVLQIEGGFRWTTQGGPIKAAISIMLNWRFIGFNMVIYLAGLQGIPDELYESAEIDGASTFQMHRLITIPMLMPIIFFALTLSIIGGFQLFDEPFILMGGYETIGGPDQGGLTVAYYLMFLGFANGRLGRGAAVAWVLFLIILLFTFINRKVTNRLQR
ncbi:MAG: sugar ABC transporter permease [Spirochaetia bacterium]|nr:sugar ABC transporter permease [Spirochaetia bacterium]